MKKEKRKLISFIGIGLCCLMGYSSHAQLSIDAATDPSSSSTCDGSIDITAAGNAGPFSVEIISSSSGDTLSSTPGVSGTSSASGLCEGDYDVYAVNRFGCSHALGTVSLGNGASIAPPDVTKNRDDKGKDLSSSETHEVISHPSVRAYPNPFAHDVTISIKAYGDVDYGIQIYDVVGQIVYDKTVAVDKGVNDFLITDMKSAPSGIYLVHITNREQRIIESFKIFKTDNGGQDDDD